MALTATAMPEIADDILRELGMERALVVHLGIERPRLSLEVRRTPNEAAKWDAIVALLHEEPGSVIVYVATVRDADDLAKRLRDVEPSVVAYHGELHAAGGIHQVPQHRLRGADAN